MFVEDFLFINWYPKVEVLMSKHPLCLHHELALLVIDDSKGTFGGSMYHYGLAGSILSELLLQGFLSVTDEKEKIVSVMLEKPTGDPILDEVVVKISASSKPRGLQHWVGEVAGMKDLAHRIAGQLCELGILERVEGKILWLFTRRTWPELDGSYENAIRQRMADAMFTENQKIDERTSVLIALASSSSVLNSNFAPVELRQHDVRIKEISKGKLLAAGATQDAIVAVQAAMMAVMVATTAASTASMAAST